MKKILVTGASSGIGRTIAELLVAQGHEVWGTSRARSMTPCSSRWASPISTCGKINRTPWKRTVVFRADSARKNSLSFSKVDSLRTANALSGP
jgi:NAD(P)-dependent dehydrogenase (short-subunit alcohol dehydrogenase family)